MINCAIDKHGLSIEGKVRIIKEIQEPLAAINDRVAQSLYVQQLAERLGIAENAILERINEVTAHKKKKSFAARELSEPAEAAHGSGVAGNRIQVERIGNRFERQIIAMMLQFPDILPEIDKLNVLNYFENTVLKEIGNYILKSDLDSADRISELISRADSNQKRKLMAALAMGDESWNMEGCLRLLGKFVESGQKQRDSGALDEQIRVAEKNNDHELLLKLLSQKQKMAERNEKRKLAILSDK